MLTTLVLILVVSLSISFVCSLLEACVLSISNADVATIEQKSPRLGRIWRDFKKNLQRPLAVILILNTFAHTIGASLSGAYFETLYGQKWLVVFSIAVSFAMIQWAEILPKTLGVQLNRQLAPLIAVPLQWVITVFGPVVDFVHLLNRPFDSKKAPDAPSTADEITALAHSALLSRQMEPQQVKIIEAGADLAEKKAKEIMVPVEEISFLDADMSPQDAFLKAHMDAHTRYPLCENNDLDRIMAYVNFKELVSILRTNPENATLRGIARPILFVSPDQNGSAIIKSLVEGRWHIAIVRDADHKTIGLLTMEDVVEELVGAIEDEFDHLPRTFHPLGENRFAVGGGFPIKDLAQRLEVSLPGLEGSVSDWITARLGHTPRPNETAAAATLTFTVQRIRRQRAFEVMVTSKRSSDS